MTHSYERLFEKHNNEDAVDARIEGFLWDGLVTLIRGLHSTYLDIRVSMKPSLRSLDSVAIKDQRIVSIDRKQTVTVTCAWILSHLCCWIFSCSHPSESYSATQTYQWLTYNHDLQEFTGCIFAREDGEDVTS